MSTDWPSWRYTGWSCLRWVIRTDTDKGVIALLDDRFMTGEYERMYPREWNRIFPVSLGNAYKCIKDFWTEQDI